MHFPEEGTHLERYAQIFQSVEINSSFYRPHKPSTYERWSNSVPEEFRFAVKIPKAITHVSRLIGTDKYLRDFLSECSHLGTKLGPLLVQLPPSLLFDTRSVDTFFTLLRAHFSGDVVCEPRHPSWFAPEPESLLSGFHVARVAADPHIVQEAEEPGGWSDLVYYRLHGSPRIYYSAYAHGYLQALAQKLTDKAASGCHVWCIFDNTAEGAATANARSVMGIVDNLTA